MRLATASEMRAADEASFVALGVTSRAIMEVAAQAITDFIVVELSLELSHGVVVYFGTGNNGGDGLFVARNLYNQGFEVVAVGVPESELKSGAAEAFAAYRAVGGKVAKDISELQDSYGVAVDAIYGIGFRGSVPGSIRPLIESFNSSAAAKVSVDIPSGMEADSSAAAAGLTAEPDITLALHLPKYAHVFYPAAENCGEVFVLDIGLVNSLPEIENLHREILDDAFVAELLAEQRPFAAGAHKGTRGRVIIVGGSGGSLGAPKLSAIGAFRGGAGLVTVASKDKNIGLVPDPVEIMTRHIDSGVVGLCAGQDSLVVGPGLGTTEVDLLRSLLAEANQLNGTVIDADALTILAAAPELRTALTPATVLTPHPGEMSRLLGISVPEIEQNRVLAAEKLCGELGCVVALKGASTVVAIPDEKTYVCPIAEPTLGVAGSGDVLAGVIGALIAQGYTPGFAAVIGVYLHARAGQLVAERLPGGALASEIAGEIPAVRQAISTTSAGQSGCVQLRPSW